MMAIFSVQVRYRTNSGCNIKQFNNLEARGFSEAIDEGIARVRKQRGVIKIDGGDAVLISGQTMSS